LIPELSLGQKTADALPAPATAWAVSSGVDPSSTRFLATRAGRSYYVATTPDANKAPATGSPLLCLLTVAADTTPANGNRSVCAGTAEVAGAGLTDGAKTVNGLPDLPEVLLVPSGWDTGTGWKTLGPHLLLRLH
jgi:hypothetical protein